MFHKKLIKGLVLGSIFALTLAGCSGKAPSAVQPQDGSSLGAEVSASNGQDTATLYIGVPDHLKEVPVADASSAEALIAALAKETGWNLTLAQPPTAGELQNTKQIAFAADSAIYGAPPEKQKDSYHVFDSEDYILTVLNSVSETLCKNLDLDGIYFTAPDGGVLTIQNGGYSFCYSNFYCWDYSFAKDCNEPLPEDEIGSVFVNPSQLPVVEGPTSLTVIFKRPNMQLGTGLLTIYNGDGTVFETIPVDHNDQVRKEQVTDYERNYYNLKEGEGTSFHIFPSKNFEAGKEYSVSLEAGAFKTEDGLKSQEITKEQWFFQCLNIGLTVTPELGQEPVIQVGKPVTYHFRFSDDVRRVYVVSKENKDYSCSVKELTSDGDMVFTPKKLGKISWEIKFELKDGNIISILENPTVVE